MSSNEIKKHTENVAPRGASAHAVRYAVSDLLQGGREAVLEHNGFEYRLRITANGRLILTK
jgi:hemin uptake protein HemP